MALGQQTQTKGAVFGVTGFGVPQPVAKPFTGESGKVEKHLFSEFLTPKTPVVFGAPSGSVSTGFSTKSNAGEVQNVIPFNFSSPVPNSPFESQLSSSIGSSGISTSRDDNEESIDEDSEEEEEQVKMQPQANLNHQRPLGQKVAKSNPSKVVPLKPNPEQEARQLAAHLSLLSTATELQDSQEVTGTPLFTKPVQNHVPAHFTQYGFLAGMSSILEKAALEGAAAQKLTAEDPRLFFNIASPSSAFICGSQGSGKSHTLSCLLENCLTKSFVNNLENPLAGLVFHYDSFTSDNRGTPCEAAYLASDRNIKVRVLCSPTNLETIKRTYQGLRVQIEPLLINQSNLNTQRMLDLMAVNQEDGPMPLYLHAIYRILRDMRITQQQTNSSFHYGEFKRQVEASSMTPAQQAPLNQRLDTLESFMPKSQTSAAAIKMKAKGLEGNDWTIKPGSLTIVDLSCPCVTSEGACALFNMCLSLFLEQPTTIGRVIALDEAHKYMNSTTEATNLTNTLLSSIRLQRHLGARVFISTQEPTISPALLDLCSFTIVHRFTSPEWLRCLKSHLAALSHDDANPQSSTPAKVFSDIVKLRVGEALLFAPSAIIGIEKMEGGDAELKRLGVGYMKIKIRARITDDGGKSVLAT